MRNPPRMPPTLGGLISDKRGAYAYLRFGDEIPPAPQMTVLIAAGFTDPSWTSYALGTACLYRAAKP